AIGEYARASQKAERFALIDAGLHRDFMPAPCPLAVAMGPDDRALIDRGHGSLAVDLLQQFWEKLIVDNGRQGDQSAAGLQNVKRLIDQVQFQFALDSRRRGKK